MKKKICIFLSIVFISLAPGRPEETNAKIKAIYIYNFTKYIEWPESYRQGNFVIGIVGNNSTLVNELNKMATVKTVGNQHLEIKNIASNSDVDCHIIYLLSDSSTQLAEVMEKNKNKSTLIITDKAGLASKGAGINFIVQENKQKIELNRSNIERYKLKVASSLVELAIQVK